MFLLSHTEHLVYEPVRAVKLVLGRWYGKLGCVDTGILTIQIVSEHGQAFCEPVKAGGLHCSLKNILTLKLHTSEL